MTKVHVEVAKLRREGFEFIMIGHKAIRKSKGTMGQLTDGIYLVEEAADVPHVRVKDPSKLAVVTQTTLSVDDTARSLPPCASTSRRCASPSRTSAMQRKTARTLSRSWRRRSMS